MTRRTAPAPPLPYPPPLPHPPPLPPFRRVKTRSPINLGLPEILRLKVYEPILVAAVRQAIAKAH